MAEDPGVQDSPALERSATEAISSAEVVLRELIEQILSDEFGADWLDQSGLKPERIGGFKARRKDDAARREGAKVTDRLLDYSDIGDLKVIILGNWSLFEDVLGDRTETEVYLDRLADLRNPDKHSRGLVPFERALILGMAGEIRNKVTIYRSEKGPTQEFFPRIEYIKDSFGNEARSGSTCKTNLILHPGDVVTVESHGWDPEGGELVWRYDVRAGTFAPTYDMEGNILEWHVSEEDIADPMHVVVYLLSKRPYHRRRWWDDMALLEYRVLPRRT